MNSVDRIITALTVWREAEGEPWLGKVGVAWVIRNRSLDAKKRWPRQAAAVCCQKFQFSCWNPGDPRSRAFPDEGSKPWLDSQRAVDAVFADVEPDPTGGANHYEALPEGKEPVWAAKEKRTVRIGAHEFYKL